MDIIIKRQWFISSKLHNIKSEYKFLEEIGRGTYGLVYKAQHMDSGIYRAIKVVQKSIISDYNTFITEISILKNLDHPNIINIIETFESESSCFLVLEYYSGGELFERIIKEKRFSEQKAAVTMKSLFSAVMYCHSHNVCHRDLKPENCLYVNDSPESDIKIIDFGLSVVTNEQEALHDIHGTPYYIAPEVLAGNYNKLADCWSLGIILYMLLSGTPPFNGKNNEEILMSVYNASLTFRSKTFKVISDSAKDLISRLLVKDPAYRMTAEQAFNHEWVRNNSILPTVAFPDIIINGLSRFVASKNLKKAALMFIASKLEEEEISELRKDFQKIDINGDGVISKEELQKVMSGIKEFANDEALKIIEGVDFNGNGYIDYTEFIAGCLKIHNYTNKGLLKSSFKYFDKDGSGFITSDELRDVFHSSEIRLNETIRIEEMINEADTNQDGKIDYHEFLKLLSVKSINF